MRKIAIYTIAAFTLYACDSTDKLPTETVNQSVKETTAATVVTTQEPQTTDSQTSATAKANQVSFNGTFVIPPQSMATVSLTMGGVIRNTNLLPGQFVQKGSVLATLDNPEFIELQQTWLECNAQAEYLQAEYERQKTLSDNQAASQKKFQQSKAEYLSMKSKLEASEAQLSLLGISTSELLKNNIQPLLQVKAPISGYISTINMNIGKYMSPGDALCEIIDKRQILLKLTAYEKDLENITPNSALEFRVNGMDNQAFTATIISIGQKVDEVSRSLEVYAKVNETNAQFRPGMYVTAQLKK